MIWIPPPPPPQDPRHREKFVFDRAANAYKPKTQWQLDKEAAEKDLDRQFPGDPSCPR